MCNGETKNGHRRLLCHSAAAFFVEPGGSSIRRLRSCRQVRRSTCALSLPVLPSFRLRVALGATAHDNTTKPSVLGKARGHGKTGHFYFCCFFKCFHPMGMTLHIPIASIPASCQEASQTGSAGRTCDAWTGNKWLPTVAGVLVAFAAARSHIYLVSTLSVLSSCLSV